MILILNAVTRENKIKPEKKLLDLVTHIIDNLDTSSFSEVVGPGVRQQKVEKW